MGRGRVLTAALEQQQVDWRTQDDAYKGLIDHDGLSTTLLQHDHQPGAQHRASLGPIESKQSMTAWLMHHKMNNSPEAEHVPLVHMSAGVVGGPHCLPSVTESRAREGNNDNRWKPVEMHDRQPKEVLSLIHI